jgi:hypothetical protein
MQLGLFVIVLAIAMAVGYCVVFSLAYPLVQVDTSIVALCAMLGLLTALGSRRVETLNKKIGRVFNLTPPSFQ